MPDLPYFDLLMDDRPNRGKFSQLWEDQVHWGYWESPEVADGTLADYVTAMEQMNALLFDAGKVADGQTLLDVGCGFGGTIRQIDATHTAMDLTGLNIDPRQLAIAKTQSTPSRGNAMSWAKPTPVSCPSATTPSIASWRSSAFSTFHPASASSRRLRGCSNRVATWLFRISCRS